MTDARLPGRWVTDPVMDALSDRAWRTFTGALMWANEAGTDGRIPARALRFLHPHGVDPVTRDELVTAGLWAESVDGVEVLNWLEIGQELAETVAARKEQNRIRQQKYRDEQTKKLKKLKPVPDDVTDDVTRDVTPHVGQVQVQDTTRQEQADYEGEELEHVNSETGEVGWPTAVPGRPERWSDPGYCSVCGGPWPCERSDQKHEQQEARRSA